jgi:polyisoprenoid-binding protein YceI
MATTKWVLDPTHSELGFKIRHLMISNVSGSFKNFKAEVETDEEDFTNAKINLVADMSSITTNNEQRDAHLQNGDFFDVEKFPELKFNSLAMDEAGDNEFILRGELTLKGITKPVRLNVELNGITKDPWGNQRAGFIVSGKINRSEWGVNFNGVLETGGVMLSEEVKIVAEIQLVKQVAAVAVAA